MDASQEHLPPAVPSHERKGVVMHNLWAYLSIATALVAAALWFCAARVEVPTRLGGGYGGKINGLEETSAALAKVAQAQPVGCLSYSNVEELRCVR
jgi:hypothetical protein